ncbi:MAG: diacylglycerol/lipid kinase family protein [Thermoanaerobaculia bacterium]
MPEQRIVFIENPAAGKGRERRQAARIRTEVERAGFFGTWCTTEAPGHGVALAEEGARDGAAIVVAVGGDGTVGEVVGGLMRVAREARPILAVLPAGTGCDYARLLGHRRWDIARAAAILRARKVRTMDAGDVNGLFFANGVGLGFDGAVAADAARLRLIRGFAAYLTAVFRVLRTWKNFRLTAEVDGEILDGPAILAAVTIGPASGGGFYLTPDAKPDDGLFDFCRLGDFRKLEAVRHLPKALNGSHVRLAKTTMRRGRSVTLRADRALVAHVDGNVISGVAHEKPLVFRMHEGALRVIGGWEGPGEKNGAQGRN